MSQQDYPGAAQSTATGINDNGTVIGSYYGNGGSNGYIYHSGNWATLNFPGTGGPSTSLVGISNGNVVVGINSASEPPSSFLYANGTFKVISIPNSYETIVGGISANGLISGNVAFNISGGGTSSSGFTAVCK